MCSSITHYSAVITHLRQQKVNDLLAIALDDGSVRIADIDTMQVVRRLPTGAHSRPITDMLFDHRWINLYLSTIDSAASLCTRPLLTRRSKCGSCRR